MKDKPVLALCCLAALAGSLLFILFRVGQIAALPCLILACWGWGQWWREKQIQLEAKAKAQFELNASQCELRQLQECVGELRQSAIRDAQRFLELKAAISADRQLLEAELENQIQEQNEAQRALRERIAALADRLATQVSVAIAEAEPAITGAINDFIAVSQDTWDIAERARRLTSTDESGGISKLVTLSTIVMNEVVEHLMTTSADTSTTAAQMRELFGTADLFVALLDEIDTVADQANALAINADAEAARTGSEVHGVAVIAAEAQRLSGRLRNAAGAARTLTVSVAQCSRSVCRRMDAAAISYSANAEEAQQEILQLMTAIEQADDRMRDMIKDISVESMAISEEITGIVIALQCHDLLRQRLEHVAAPLCELRDSIIGTSLEEILPDELPIAVGQSRAVVRAVGTGPELKIVSYSASPKEINSDADDTNITLF